MDSKKELKTKETGFAVANISDRAISTLCEYMPEHQDMLATINTNLPEIARASSVFCKTQSQFMDNMLTVSHLTPLRNVRQILAEINKTKSALTEAHFKRQKEEIEIKILLRSLDSEKDDLERELIENKINHKRSTLANGEGYISGAIRRITNYVNQMNAIKADYDITDFNEEDFEKEEERYHIMKAFEQGLTSARSRPDNSIDEGNQIYLHQIGVNGTMAAMEVKGFLHYEAALINKHIEDSNNPPPAHDLTINFLNQMADKYEGSSQVFAKEKGMSGTMTSQALIQTGDTRLLESRKESKS
jgi:hypothetical protein